jgi:hypothetical protein
MIDLLAADPAAARVRPPIVRLQQSADRDAGRQRPALPFN